MSLRADVTSQGYHRSGSNMASHSNVSVSVTASSESISGNRKRKKTGKECSVGECSLRISNDVSLHKFPGDASLNRQWVQFVRTCRSNFVQTENSFVCSKHFTADSYPETYSVRESLGFTVKRKLLNPTAVPTIHKHELSHATTIAGKKLKERGLPVPTSSCCTSVTTTRPTVSASSFSTVTTCVSSGLSVRVVRGAYAKREKKRMLEEMLATHSTATTSFEDSDSGSSLVDLEAAKDIDTLQTAETVATVELGLKTAKTKKNKKIMVSEKYFMRHKGTQTALEVKNAITQCNMGLLESTTGKKVKQSENTDSQVQCTPEKSISRLDSDNANSDVHSEYEPSTDDESSSDELQSKKPDNLHSSEPKYIVYHQQLMQLFQTCCMCAKPALGEVIDCSMGSIVRIRQECSNSQCKHLRTWDSQPYVRNIPAGNLLMSAAILFSGSLPSKVLLFLTHMGVKAVSESTFFDHQRTFLHTAVEKVWSSFQQQYVAACHHQQRRLTLGGDGRADSPGHSAKYGTYSMMDLDIMKVVDVRTVQSNEAGNSNAMEKMGLLSSLQFFNENNLPIREFISDRHPQIMKHMREKKPDIVHSIDVWHVAKGLKKKLIVLSKEKDCCLLSEWIRSIINHLYWIPVSSNEESTPEAKKDASKLKLEKWDSLMNHLHDVHEHSGEHFTICAHPSLQGRERQKKWLKPGSKLSTKLEDLLSSRQLRKDIPMLSTGPQTSALESFHSNINRFAPKMCGFHYEGIVYRVVIAALDFNENGGREQAARKDGTKRWNLAFTKAKSNFTLQEIKVDKTYRYVQTLLAEVGNLASRFSLRDMDKVVRDGMQTKNPLCVAVEKPDVADAIAERVSRYCQK